MTTFNPADKSANITLSNGNLTATPTTTADGAVRSTTSKTTGKVYFEFTWGTATGSDTSCGVSTGTAGLGSMGPSASGGVFCYAGGGTLYVNGTYSGISIGALQNHTVGVAFDADTGRVWFRPDNSSLWNNSAAADPTAGTGGLNASALFPANPIFAVVTHQSTTSVCTVNFGASPYVAGAPGGFIGWDPPAGPIDLRNSAEAREVLFSEFPGGLITSNVREVLTANAQVEPRVAGIVRESLVWTPTAVLFGGLVRETLLVSPPRISGQVSVSVNVGS